MKNRLSTSRFARLIHLPTALLITFLQRTPVLRVLAAAEEFVFSTPAAHVIKATIATAAALGAVDTMAGATSVATTAANPLSAMVGTPVNVAFNLTVAQYSTGSWRIAGVIPPGLYLTNSSTATTGVTSGLINADNLFLEGTPTTAGSYVINLTAYEFPAGGAPASPLFAYTVNVAASTATPPMITVQPYSTGTTFGGSVTLSLQATNASAYQWSKDGTAVGGATQASFTISNAQAGNAGTYTCEVTSSTGGKVTSSAAAVIISSPTEAASVRLFNISTRSFVGTGDGVQIAGLIIGGTQPKKVLIRASGPALTQYGVTGVLADPVIDLFSGSTVINHNDNWNTDPNVPAFTAATGATVFAQGSKDAALAVTLSPGAYTAIVSGANGGTGVALIEAFEADGSSSPSKLVNISTRSQVLTGDQVQIVGLIVNGTAAKKLLIRAKGPALAQDGVTGVLADPMLTLYSGSSVIGGNDNWGTDPNVPAFTAAAGPAPFPNGSKDSAMAVTLAPGAYTAIVSGVNSTTGVALIEVYEVP